MRDAAEYALDALKKAGAGKASVRVSKSRSDEFNIEANKFTLLRTMFDDSISLKALVDGRKGVAIVNKLDKPSIDEAVEDCITLAKSAQPDEAEDIAPLGENKSFDQTIGGADLDKLFERSKEYLEQVKEQFPKIVIDNFSSAFGGGEYAYVNSNGVSFDGKEESYGFNSLFAGKEGEKSSSFNHTGFGLKDLDTPFLKLGMHSAQLEESVKSLETRIVDGKFTGKIIVTPTCPDIWYNLFYCFLGDAPMIEGTSRWKDALNTLVANPALTLRTIPLNPKIVEGERFTNDGFLSQDMDIIKDGVLKSFFLSLYGANKTGKPRALNTSMNIEVLPGTALLEEMIKGIEKGVLVNRFSGASPSASGEVTGVAKNSFLIENGKVTDALQETMISFNVLDALKNITAISKESICDGGSILPWVCFDGITVSGK